MVMAASLRLAKNEFSATESTETTISTEKASISSSAAKITPQEIKTHAQFTFSRGGQAYSSRDYVTYNELPGIRHCQYPIMSCRKNVCPSKTIAASKGTLAVYSLCRSR
ncbi:hypothetical protein GN958_ATG04960 [Phytophthora infestans]|uniref:Uncharacterized protein n=1 Tax=Phytophthora infestans TaxID=4787 RepID=A0A8S9UYS3_PHYIN|nr:hypothetical protein GN958_ATG04960 [Phytophthora infestans]